jgi:hypothetical protein
VNTVVGLYSARDGVESCPGTMVSPNTSATFGESDSESDKL